MGIITIEEEKFLVYTKTVYLQQPLPQNLGIYQIAKVDFIPFTTLMSNTKQIL